jgi:F0F1-type ATP synthase membrane subunit b/b'
MSADSKNRAVKLGGKEFDRVENGLDEVEVAAYISELVKRNQELESSREDTAALHRLAERYVTEADRLAQQIRAEAKERANQECEAIISKAEKEAQKIIDEKLAEVMSGAKKRAEQIEAEAAEKAGRRAAEIQAEAEQKAANLLKNGINKVRDELGAIVNQEFDLLLQELQSLERQTIAAKVKLEQRFTPVRQEQHAALDIPSSVGENVSGTEAQKEPEQTKADIPVDEGENTFAAHETTVELVMDIETGEDENKLSGKCDIEAKDVPFLLYEVQVQPPVDIDRVMKLVAHLDRAGSVRSTEMKLDNIENPIISVFLNEPVDMVSLLEESAEVSSAENVLPTGDNSIDTGYVQVSLAGQKTRNKKGFRANLASLRR